MGKFAVIYFTTLNGNAGEISIYKDNYNGSVKEFIPASQPISTQEDDDDNLFFPVRGKSGYIRVIDNGNASVLLPEDNMQHEVILKINGAVKFCGYMQSAQYTSDWDSTPIEVEYPIASGLTSLESVNMPQVEEMGYITFAALLHEAIGAAGNLYKNIIYPQEFKAADGSGTWTYPFECSVARANFYSASKKKNKTISEEENTEFEGITYKEMLEEWCKFFGWTLHEQGEYLVFVSNNNVGYEMIPVSLLDDIVSGSTISGSTISIAEIPMADLKLDGADNVYNILQGKKNISIVSKVNTVGNMLPDMDYKEFDYKWSNNGTGQNSRDKTAQCRILYYKVPGWYRLKQYLYDDNYNIITDITPITIGKSWSAINGGHFYRMDYFNDTTGKINYAYGDYIKLSNDLGREGTRRKYKCIEVLSEGAILYSNGAFNVDFELGMHVSGGVPYSCTTIGSTLEINARLQVGKYFWNGSTWSTTACDFVIPINPTDEYLEWHNIESNKTLAMPFTANGYVMPINRAMSGNVKFTMYEVSGYIFDLGIIMPGVILKNFRFTYVEPDDDVNGGKSNDNENEYSAATGRYEEDEKIELSINTNNSNPAAYSKLVHKGSEVVNVKVGDSLIRPEENLLNTAKRIYGVNTEMLKVQFEREDILPFAKIARGGKVYRIQSEDVDWADDSAMYTMIQQN